MPPAVRTTFSVKAPPISPPKKTAAAVREPETTAIVSLDRNGVLIPLTLIEAPIPSASILKAAESIIVPVIFIFTPPEIHILYIICFWRSDWESRNIQFVILILFILFVYYNPPYANYIRFVHFNLYILFVNHH